MSERKREIKEVERERERGTERKEGEDKREPNGIRSSRELTPHE